ncbi:MAG: CHASE domain-containing protein [Burkholderiales bacterium]|nr:CHASE domain-containing protein [Burkholderiales bacterium]
MRTMLSTRTKATFLQVLALALVYALAGRASQLLAIPPGYSIAVYPPAGIALGVILAFGQRLLPGVTLGSFLLNVFISYEHSGQITGNAIALAAVIACGATLQATIGSRIIRERLHGDLALDADHAIFYFFLYGGVFACLISSSVGVASLVILNVLPMRDAISNWITWWAGDTLGVLTITPVILVLYGKPKDIWRSRRWSVLLPLAVCLFMVITAFAFIRHRENQKQQLEFRLEAERVSQNLQNKLNRHADIMQNIERLYASSYAVDRDEFSTFVEYALANYKAISCLSWAPKVSHQQREAFETSVLREGFINFHVKERDDNGQMVTAAQRDDYFPLKFIEPFAPATFGFDMGSSTVRRNAIEDARDSGHLTVTDPLTPFNDHSSQLAVMLFAPVYSRGHTLDNIEHRRAAFIGVVVSKIRMGDLVSDVLSHEEKNNLLVKFYDLSYPGKDGIFINNITQLDNTYLYQSTINFGGKQYAFLAQPSDAYWHEHVSWITWITMVGGLLFSGLLGAYLLMATAHTYGVENLVKQRTAQLHDSEERLRTILSNAAEGILTTDENGVIESANQSADMLFTDSSGTLVGTHLLNLFPNPESQAFLSHHLQVTGNTIYGGAPKIGDRIEVLGRKKNGASIPLELAISKARLGDQTLLVIILHDLSEIKRAQKLKSEFVSAVSHELRTPLTSIRGVLGLLVGGVGGAVSDQAKSMLVMANDNATRLTTLINDLLDFEKLEYGSLHFHFETLSLTDLVKKSIQSNLGYAQNFGVNMRFDFSSAVVHQVHVDAQRFIQVLSNLLSNAIKFSRENGQVDIRISEKNGWAKVEIQDYGIGISEEFKSSIFQKFTQEDAKAARKYAGTGLGLSLSKTMIEKMSGKIGFTSVEGQGSIFYLILPVVSSAAVTPSATVG